MNKSSINSKIEVSIIIVNYNTGALLKECIDSIVLSTNKLTNPVCEIIVVDNSSTDNSADIKGPFTMLKNADNPGFPAANNQAIAKAKGDYLLLLNPDTKILGNAIEVLLEFAKNKDNVGVVVPQLLNSDMSIQDSVMPLPTISRAIREFWFKNNVYSKFSPKGNDPLEVEAAVMAAFLITPNAREKVGLLNEKYFMYFEDLDYCRKVQQSGLKIYYLPHAQVIHYHGVSGKALSDADNQWRRLIPSSKAYHGNFKDSLLNFVIWFGSRVLHRK
jgi:GT2 family glycosyltransferase